MLIHGSCHCGNIDFALNWEPSPAEIPARACGCAFCSKHGGVWTSNPRGSLTVRVRNPSLVSPYRFGTQTAQFHVCRQCGVVPVVTSEIDGQLYAVVNVNTFGDLPPSLLRRAATSFESEDVAARLARRKRNWIPAVQFVERGS